MSKIKGMKSVSLLLGMLLCLSLIQASCAQPEELAGNVTYENATCENATISEFTVHTITPSFYSTNIMSGKSETFNVRFRNEGDETLNVAPKLVAMPYSSTNFNDSWITISPENMSVEPGTEQNFAININVPKDVDSSTYQAYIAFTDDISLDSPPDVNVLGLYVGVQAQPKLELQTSSISDTFEAGKEYEYTMKIKNVADKDITIDPEVIGYNNYYDSYSSESAFDDDVIEISAPSTIKAGEITNMTIRIPVPKNATGTYNGYIEMNVDGKFNDGSVPQLGLYFTVRQSLASPYVKTFSTTTTDPITIEVSTDSYDQNMGLRISPKKEDPSFELNLKYNSSPVDLTLVKATQTGYVSVGGYYFPVWAMDDNGLYQNNGNHYAETYTIPGAIGNWELTVFPKNTEAFGYSITIGDSK